MYDFYNKPPKNLNDIIEYLTSRFKPINEYSNIPIIFNEYKFIPYSGFRRAFYSHIVYLDKDKLKYCFYVDTDDKIWNGENNPPNMGIYNSYDELILEVSKKYLILWKL